MFQGQQFMNLEGIVPAAFEMTPYYGFYALGVQVRPGKGPRVKQHFANIFGKGIPVPYPEMIVLMPAKEEPFQAEGRKEMIDSCHPLRHTVVVGIFGLHGKKVELAEGRSREITRAATEAEIGQGTPECGIAVAYQSQSKVIIRRRFPTLPIFLIVLGVN